MMSQCVLYCTSLLWTNISWNSAVCIYYEPPHLLLGWCISGSFPGMILPSSLGPQVHFLSSDSLRTVQRQKGHGTWMGFSHQSATCNGTWVLNIISTQENLTSTEHQSFNIRVFVYPSLDVLPKWIGHWSSTNDIPWDEPLAIKILEGEGFRAWIYSDSQNKQGIWVEKQTVSTK